VAPARLGFLALPRVDDFVFQEPAKRTLHGARIGVKPLFQ
jgi:hypothetical protein